MASNLIKEVNSDLDEIIDESDFRVDNLPGIFSQDDFFRTPGNFLGTKLLKNVSDEINTIRSEVHLHLSVKKPLQTKKNTTFQQLDNSQIFIYSKNFYPNNEDDDIFLTCCKKKEEKDITQFFKKENFLKINKKLYINVNSEHKYIEVIINNELFILVKCRFGIQKEDPVELQKKLNQIITEVPKKIESTKLKQLIREEPEKKEIERKKELTIEDPYIKKKSYDDLDKVKRKSIIKLLESFAEDANNNEIYASGDYFWEEIDKNNMNDQQIEEDIHFVYETTKISFDIYRIVVDDENDNVYEINIQIGKTKIQIMFLNLASNDDLRSISSWHSIDSFFPNDHHSSTPHQPPSATSLQNLKTLMCYKIPELGYITGFLNSLKPDTQRNETLLNFQVTFGLNKNIENNFLKLKKNDICLFHNKKLIYLGISKRSIYIFSYSLKKPNDYKLYLVPCKEHRINQVGNGKSFKKFLRNKTLHNTHKRKKNVLYNIMPCLKNRRTSKFRKGKKCGGGSSLSRSSSKVYPSLKSPKDSKKDSKNDSSPASRGSSFGEVNKRLVTNAKNVLSNS